MYQCVRRSSSQSQPRIDSVRRKAEPQSQHAQGGASCRSEPKSGLYAVAPWQFDKLDADLVATLVGKYGYSEVLAVQTESNRLAAVASAARDGKLDVMKQLFKGIENALRARSGSFAQLYRVATRASCSGCASTSTLRNATLGLSVRESVVPDLGVKTICLSACRCCWGLDAAASCRLGRRRAARKRI